ncbi:MAG TPA: hypothetical protein VFP41_05010 [Actinomycetota bacterium]|nr:hypothetical protein [Actinomycetota bacterium]
MSELLGIARFRIHEGKVDEYKRLSAQAMEIVRTKDPGPLQYDTYLNDDESECVHHRAVQGLGGRHGARRQPRRHLGSGPSDRLRWFTANSSVSRAPS